MAFLQNSNDSEWGAPSFTKPKPRTSQLRFLSDFIYLNNQRKSKPYPILKINEILLK